MDPDQLTSKPDDLHLHCFKNKIYPGISMIMVREKKWFDKDFYTSSNHNLLCFIEKIWEKKHH